MIACYALEHRGTAESIFLGLRVLEPDTWPILAAIPCVVQNRIIDDVVRLIVSRELADAHGVFGDRMYVSSARGYDAAMARNIAEYYRPEGV